MSHVVTDTRLIPSETYKEAAKEAIYYSYTRGVNGFSAPLEEEHAFSLASELLTFNANFHSFTLNECEARRYIEFSIAFLTEFGVAIVGCCYSEHPQVLSVFPNRARNLHTTRSWGFLGLEVGAGKSENVQVSPRSLWRKG